MNTLKTVVLMAGLTVLLIMAGGAIGGRSGMLIAFILATGMNFFSYWYSDKIVLRYVSRPGGCDGLHYRRNLGGEARWVV